MYSNINRKKKVYYYKFIHFFPCIYNKYTFFLCINTEEKGVFIINTMKKSVAYIIKNTKKNVQKGGGTKNRTYLEEIFSLSCSNFVYLFDRGNDTNDAWKYVVCFQLIQSNFKLAKG